MPNTNLTSNSSTSVLTDPSTPHSGSVVKAHKLALLKTIPSTFEGVLTLVTVHKHKHTPLDFALSLPFNFPFSMSSLEKVKVHASVRSGFLILRKLNMSIKRNKKIPASNRTAGNSSSHNNGNPNSDEVEEANVEGSISRLHQKCGKQSKNALVRFLPLQNAEVKAHEGKQLHFTVKLPEISLLLKASNEKSMKDWVSVLGAEAALLNNHQINLNDFLVLKETSFGKGHFGEVNIIAHKYSNTVLALKSMSMKGFENELNIQERVILEKVNNLKDQFNISSLPRLFFAFAREETLFLVSEAYQGGNLLELLHSKRGESSFASSKTSRGFLSEASVRFIAAEMIAAISSLHSIGIAHRDIKPENIMLDSFGHIKLIDFGLAKHFTRRDDTVRLNMSLPNEINDNKNGKNGKNEVENVRYIKSYALLGTTYYQPPEMLKGHGHTLGIDWWQLGCLMYELLFGVPVFRGRSVEEIERLITSDKEVIITNTQLSLTSNATLSKSSFSDDTQRKLKSRDFDINIEEKVEEEDFKINSEDETETQFLLSKDCVDLMKLLLIREPTDRLGFVGDGSAVMSHPFFTQMDWEKVSRGLLPVPIELVPSAAKVQKFDLDFEAEINEDKKAISSRRGSNKFEFEELEEHVNNILESSRPRSEGKNLVKRTSVASVAYDKIIKNIHLGKHNRKLSDKDLSRIGLSYTYPRVQDFV